MKKGVAILAALALLSSIGTGLLVWQLSRNSGPHYPEISAYSHGHTVRVGPFLYCPVLDLDDCDFPQNTADLALNSRHPVQLAVDPAIARGPWLLVRTYEDAAAPVVQGFLPNAARTVKIPSVDARFGKLTGIVVQLPTLVRDEDGNEFPVPHAEWSVRTSWDADEEYSESVTDFQPAR